MLSIIALLLGVTASLKPLEHLKREWKHPDFESFDHFWNNTFGDDPFRPMTVVMKEVEEQRIICKLQGECPTVRPSITGARVNCVNGQAGEYPCQNVDLLSFISLSDLGSGNSADGNDIWGYEVAQRDIVISGQTDGASIVDITDPINPFVVAFIQSQRTINTIWRDFKVMDHYLYIVADGSGHGLQWIDIDQVLDAYSGSRLFIGRGDLGNYGGGLSTSLSNCHNIALNTASGFAYAVGANVASGGLYQYRVGDDTNGVPTFVKQFSSDGYTHDTECVTYRGPDIQYINREICFGYNENSLTIVDMTDGSAQMISRTTYTQSAYTHQGWLTEDHGYLLMNDELDEQRFGGNTRTRVWDVRNLQNPLYMTEFRGRTPAIDHNLYIRDNYAYMSNYRAGLSVVDVSNIAQGGAGLNEVAYFDSYPANNNPSFDGAWSNYPYFRPKGDCQNGVVVAQQDINRGLFILCVDVDPNN